MVQVTRFPFFPFWPINVQAGRKAHGFRYPLIGFRPHSYVEINLICHGRLNLRPPSRGQIGFSWQRRWTESHAVKIFRCREQIEIGHQDLQRKHSHCFTPNTQWMNGMRAYQSELSDGGRYEYGWLLASLLISDYPNLAVQSRLTMPQKPVRELAALFHTCLTKKNYSKGRAGEECEALRTTLEHSFGQKHYPMWE